MIMNDMTSDYTLQTTPISNPSCTSCQAESRFSPNNATGSKSNYMNRTVPPAPNTVIPSKPCHGHQREHRSFLFLPPAQRNSIPSINEPRLQVEQVLKDHVPKHQRIWNSARLRRPLSSLYVEKRTLPNLKNKHVETTRRVFGAFVEQVFYSNQVDNQWKCPKIGNHSTGQYERSPLLLNGLLVRYARS